MNQIYEVRLRVDNKVKKVYLIAKSKVDVARKAYDLIVKYKGVYGQVDLLSIAGLPAMVRNYD